ncbi:MAG: YeeE/YedE family protein [Amphiplicatus sp.]
MTSFTPFSALAGGAMIGAAAALLMAANGRIAGISGIVDGVMGPIQKEGAWRFAFLAGLFLAPFVYALAAGRMPQADYPHALPLMIIGGFLVGFGARFGGGCTSGHGVCGIARLSKRSLTATATFMTTAAATVFAVRAVSGG